MAAHPYEYQTKRCRKHLLSKRCTEWSAEGWDVVTITFRGIGHREVLMRRRVEA